MRTRVHWIRGIPCRLGIMGRPRSGDWLSDEIASLQIQGVDLLVTLLTPAEVVECGLEEEESLCQSLGITPVCYPVVDRSVPADASGFCGLVKRLASDLYAGRCAVIHCRAGIGRSALMAAAILIALGCTPTDALHRISDARGCEVPDTAEQRAWLEQYAKGCLDDEHHHS